MSKLNPSITQGGRAKEDEFEFKKDAGMYVYANVDIWPSEKRVLIKRMSGRINARRITLMLSTNANKSKGKIVK